MRRCYDFNANEYVDARLDVISCLGSWACEGLGWVLDGSYLGPGLVLRLAGFNIK